MSRPRLGSTILHHNNTSEDDEDNFSLDSDTDVFQPEPSEVEAFKNGGIDAWDAEVINTWVDAVNLKRAKNINFANEFSDGALAA